LDKVTDSVRAFYEAHPYPPGDRVDCDGYQVHWLLSAVERSATGARPQVLEAGCGRGLNLHAAAQAQPEADFTGIDINRVAIAEARDSAASGPANLRFLTADLMQPGALPDTEGGFDLILSYGVIHHLSEPETGLRHLRERLSPQGVVALMVDGRFGRQPLDRFLQALALFPESDPRERLATARALARAAESSLFRDTHWQGTAEVDEVEFADRCLHVHERSYTVDELWTLLDSAGLRFLRWLEPADWRPQGVFNDSPLGTLAGAMDPRQRYRLVERLYERPKLTLLAIPQSGVPRRALRPEQVADSLFRLNPQLKRQPEDGGEARWQLRRQPPASAGRCAETILLAADAMGEAFRGEAMVAHLRQRGFQQRETLETLFRLESQEWLYRPHPLAGGSRS